MRIKYFQAEYGVITNGQPAIETRIWKQDTDTGERWDEMVVEYKAAPLEKIAMASGRPQEISAEFAKH